MYNSGSREKNILVPNMKMQNINRFYWEASVLEYLTLNLHCSAFKALNKLPNTHITCIRMFFHSLLDYLRFYISR